MDLAGNEGVGSLQVTANRSPDGGRLESSPSASARLNEEVTLSAVGFVDEHLPLTYRFAFRAASASHDFPLTQEASEARTHTTTELPVGDVTLVAYVADFYGTEGASERAFTVLLPEIADDSIEGAADFVMDELWSQLGMPAEGGLRVHVALGLFDQVLNDVSLPFARRPVQGRPLILKDENRSEETSGEWARWVRWVERIVGHTTQVNGSIHPTNLESTERKYLRYP